MSMQTVTLKLPDLMLQAAQHLANEKDVTVGQIVRSLLAQEMKSLRHTKTSDRTDEYLLASLQTLLASDMAKAQNWCDLAERIAKHGYELRPAGGGLTLHRQACGTRLCKASELGFAYGTLVRRFKMGMPGHPHSFVPDQSQDQPDIDVLEKP